MTSSIGNKMAKPSETEWRRYAANFLSEARIKKLDQRDIDACLTYAKNLLLSGFPVVYDTNHFCQLVGYYPNYVMGAIKDSEKYYRSFEISKKSGGKRLISEPLPSLKEIQSWILVNILQAKKPNPAAKAYVRDINIKDNARFHRGQNYVLTVDIKDFFPSIKANRVHALFHSLGYSKQVSSLLTDLCCLDGCLPQGSPTSPYLSNLIGASMDRRLFAYARDNGLRYTRYADDLTFSGDAIESRHVSNVYEIVQGHGFEPNLKKTRVMRRHQRQQVTGVVVNSKLQVSRPYRRQLRQAAYYIDKFGIEGHAAAQDILKRNYREHLLGRANHCLDINGQDRDAARLVEVLNGVSK